MYYINTSEIPKPFHFNIFDGLKVEHVITWKKYTALKHEQYQIPFYYCNNVMKSKMMALRILDFEKSQL